MRVQPPATDKRIPRPPTSISCPSGPYEALAKGSTRGTPEITTFAARTSSHGRAPSQMPARNPSTTTRYPRRTAIAAVVDRPMFATPNATRPNRAATTETLRIRPATWPPDPLAVSVTPASAVPAIHAIANTTWAKIVRANETIPTTSALTATTRGRRDSHVSNVAIEPVDQSAPPKDAATSTPSSTTTSDNPCRISG